MNNTGALLGFILGMYTREKKLRKQKEAEEKENQEFRAACKRQMSFEDWKAANKK